MTVEDSRTSAPVPSVLLRRLRDDSGLTWEQLAKLFGVSRRALHLWANGGRLNTAHEEQLHRLIGVIEGLSAKAPGERRTSHGRTRQ